MDHVGRARALVGTRFRPQGRSHDGVDCVGLILAVFDIDPGGVRRNYRLRGDHAAEMKTTLGHLFRRVSKAEARAGDVLILRVADDQLHMAVKTATGFVHADARLGRVVEAPAEPQWPVTAIYRKRTRNRSR